MTRRAAWIRFLLSVAVLCSFSLPGYGAQKLKEKTYGEIRADKALVYFLRVPSWGKGVESLTYVYSDQEIAAILPKNSYSWTYMDPGNRTLWNSAAVRERGLTDLSSTRDVEFEAGQEYFVVLNYRVSPHVFFAFVDGDESEALLEEARFLAEAEPKDLKAADAFRAERFPWIEELRSKRQAPDTVVRRVSAAERDALLCTIRTVFVDDVKIPENTERNLSMDADTFGKALRKKLARFNFESAKTRATADAVFACRIDEQRIETRRSYKKVSSAKMSIQTLEGQEIWLAEVDNATPKMGVNSFNKWADLARRALEQLQKECRNN